MRKQEHTLTLRVPKDVIVQLRKLARKNHCSVSDIARDILSCGVTEQGDEHVFLDNASWKKAVKTRDQSQCVVCGSSDDLDVYVVDGEEDGSYTLSNGATLCLSCSMQHERQDACHENGHSVYDQIPYDWLKKYRRARLKGRTFWEQHLACFLTRRKRTISPIVEWYAETFLSDVPEEVLIQTLIELCPSPDIIAEFPSRRYTSTDEIFSPPPLVWNSAWTNGNGDE